MYFQLSTSTWANDKGCVRVCMCPNACVCVHGRETRGRERERLDGLDVTYIY